MITASQAGWLRLGAFEESLLWCVTSDQATLRRHSRGGEAKLHRNVKGKYCDIYHKKNTRQTD